MRNNEEQVTQQLSILLSCSAICTQPPVQLTGLLGVWMRHGDL